MVNTETIKAVADLITIFAILIGGVTAIFVYFQLAPVLQLRILPRWEGKDKQHLIIRFEIENKARVRVYRPWGRIQVLKYKTGQNPVLSRWIPFEKDAIKPIEPPIEWSEPIKLFTSTREIFPGETIAFERLYNVSEDTVIYHIGLQVGLELKPLERITNRKKESWRQTTTCFVCK